ncbi:fibronectin type III domain-containing protein [Thermodesulfobacterium hydrogeniphilum]|uniref:fibronectin type III domain-containing protein n=1 Tax=Thermodesulfobacterium hydrogeniphilum TaxID=161156 RepID=UPI00056DA1AB|nr:fibronectin type III domain-containing protein [Thermodesulfobacterium hydrogeniphilum]
MKAFLKYFLIFSVLAFWGCGKKSPPLSIEQSIPKDIYFEVKATQAGFELLINLPTETRGGYPLTKIKKLIIEKKEIPLDIPKAKEKVYKIKLSPKLHSAGNLIIYNDYKVKNRYAYTYRIKIEKDFLVKTSYTEPITVYWHNPPGLPKNFKIIPYEKNMVILSWEKPVHDIYGLYLEGTIFYEIEKITDSKTEIIKIKNKKEFWDKIDSSQRTCYSIRAVLNFRGTPIPGPKIPEKCIKIDK